MGDPIVDAAVIDIAVRWVATALALSVWQGALIGTACAVVGRGLHRAKASTRLALYEAGLAAMVVVPVATTALTAVGAVDGGWRWVSDRPHAWVAAWSIGVSVASLRFAVDLGRLGWLRVRSIAPPPALARRFAALAVELGVPRARLGLVASGWSPMAAGILRPIVLVPASLLGRLPADQLESLIVHELVHLARLDPLRVALQAVVETVVFYHPVTWWLSAQIGVERELATDARVADRVAPLTYARALFEVAHARRAVLAAAAGGTGMLTERIERVLGRTPTRRAPWTVPLFSAALALALLTGRPAVAEAPAVPATPDPSLTQAPAAPAAPSLAVPSTSSGSASALGALVPSARPVRPTAATSPGSAGAPGVSGEPGAVPAAPPPPSAQVRPPGAASAAPTAAHDDGVPCLTLRGEALAITACGDDGLVALRSWKPAFAALDDEVNERLVSIEARRNPSRALPPQPDLALDVDRDRPDGFVRAFATYERRVRQYVGRLESTTPLVPGWRAVPLDPMRRIELRAVVASDPYAGRRQIGDLPRKP